MLAVCHAMLGESQGTRDQMFLAHVASVLLPAMASALRVACRAPDHSSLSHTAMFRMTNHSIFSVASGNLAIACAAVTGRFAHTELLVYQPLQKAATDDTPEMTLAPFQGSACA